MSNTNPSKTREWTKMFQNDKQFHLHKLHKYYPSTNLAEKKHEWRNEWNRLRQMEHNVGSEAYLDS